MPIKTILICDKPGCDNQLELEGPYNIAKNEMKEEGWKNKQIDGEWKIICNQHK